MQILYTLKIRGTLAAVGTFDTCLTVMQERWGWVPMHLVNTVLRPELEAVGIAGAVTL